jgi:hypothetical protein
MLSNCPRVSTGKFGSVANWSTYVAAPGTAVQLKVMASSGWNVEYPLVGASTGVPGAPGPTPLAVKLWACDHAPWTITPFTACTRQKYVPSASPLTVSCVRPIVECRRTTGVRVADGLTSQL